MVDGKAVVGYNTPSRKLELFSKTMADWKWPEFALPEYYRSHIHRSAQAASMGDLTEKSGADFDPKLYAACGMAERCEWRSCYSAADFSAAPSDPHALGELEISLRDRAQKSALAKSR